VMSQRVSGKADIEVVSISPEGFVAAPVSRAEAHRAPGILHLAVSVQVVDPAGRWLLQRRAEAKPAFPGCWANTCCTHPFVGEEPAAAALRRLGEEVGLRGEVIQAGTFVYRATDPASGLVEYEMDHLFVAVTAIDAVRADPAEIAETAGLPYAEALRLVTSKRGVPWGAEVLRRAFRVLNKR